MSKFSFRNHKVTTRNHSIHTTHIHPQVYLSLVQIFVRLYFKVQQKKITSVWYFFKVQQKKSLYDCSPFRNKILCEKKIKSNKSKRRLFTVRMIGICKNFKISFWKYDMLILRKCGVPIIRAAIKRRLLLFDFIFFTQNFVSKRRAVVKRFFLLDFKKIPHGRYFFFCWTLK